MIDDEAAHVTGVHVIGTDLLWGDVIDHAVEIEVEVVIEIGDLAEQGLDRVAVDSVTLSQNSNL